MKKARRLLKLKKQTSVKNEEKNEKDYPSKFTSNNRLS